MCSLYGYVALPKGVESNVLTVKDSDSGNVRTRTYSYQGVGLYDLQTDLPITIYQNENTQTFSTFYQIRGLDPILPCMAVILSVLCIGEIFLIISAVLRKRSMKNSSYRYVR